MSARDEAKRRVRSKVEADKALPASEYVRNMLHATHTHDEADAKLSALRAEVRAEGLSEPERTFLAFALGLAADRMASRGDEFTAEDEAALTSLRAMAAAAPVPVKTADDETAPRPVTDATTCPHCGYTTTHCGQCGEDMTAVTS